MYLHEWISEDKNSTNRRFSTHFEVRPSVRPIVICDTDLTNPQDMRIQNGCSRQCQKLTNEILMTCKWLPPSAKAQRLWQATDLYRWYSEATMKRMQSNEDRRSLNGVLWCFADFPPLLQKHLLISTIIRELPCAAQSYKVRPTRHL